MAIQVSNSPNLTRSEMRKQNAESFNAVVNGRMVRPPIRSIYIFSVARRSFTAKTVLFPKLVLKGCENGERYVRCTSLSDPITQVSPDIERGGNRTDEHDGWLAAVDLLNPLDNPSTDPYARAANPDFYANRNGTNLICEGLFPSLNEEPTEDEIRRAEQARDRRYRYLTGEATRLAAVSTKDLNEFLTRWPDTHTAMQALGLTATWTQSNDVKMTCPNCGDSVKQNIAFHQSSAGVLCVIDPYKAMKAGAITKERMQELMLPTEEEAEEVRRGPGRPRKIQ